MQTTYIYDGCELDDAYMRAKVAEFLDHAM